MLLFLVLLVALALPAPAAASHRGDLWATVNICDTEEHPNVLGIRASMPGNGTRQTMWMRFYARYFDRETGTWRRVGGTARSPWIKLGSARFRSRQSGRKFTIEPPLPTTSHVVRGIVKYQWRRKRKGRDKVVKRRKQKTLSGHPTGRHGDPRGYSNGICEITYP